MAVNVEHCPLVVALQERARLAVERPEMDDQILVSSCWRVVDVATGEALALVGVADVPDARLFWMISSPRLRRRLRSFLPVARRFISALPEAERPVLVETTAVSGAKLARLLGLQWLCRCRDGAEYWLMEAKR